jgi:hypothetical protein
MWRKSSYSAKTDCVALCRFADGSIGVRNTNDSNERVLIISADDLAEWLARIKAGAFDDLIRGLRGSVGMSAERSE